MEVTYNMEYRRIHPRPSLPSPPSHTFPYTNSIPLDSWSIFRYNTIPLFSLRVHRDVLTIPLGSLCVHRDAPTDKPPIKISPSIFPPHPGFYVLCYISYKRQHRTVCVPARCRVQSSGIFVTRIIVTLWPTCVVLSRCVSSPVA